ncbi:MAG: S49 family peptidase [Cocleimonas sp.]
MLNNENQQAIEALKDVAMAGIKEQRSSRRWSIFFKIMSLLVLLLLIGAMFGVISGKDKRLTAATNYTAVVDVQGVIMQGAEASADNIIPALQEAFKDPKASGVILRCNSPGGSPVQSAYVYDEIMRLRDLYPDKKVVAVAADLCASGGYFIISAAEEIYANKSSLVGSIGVRMQGFGLVGAMEKLGIENRELTAGENKAILDPFSPRKPEDEAFVKKMLATTHKHFIDAVKAGRGDRLANDPDIFSGLFWTGEDAKALGLIDGYGSPASIAREIIKAETMINFSPKDDVFERLSKRVGTSAASILLNLNQSASPVLHK